MAAKKKTKTAKKAPAPKKTASKAGSKSTAKKKSVSKKTTAKKKAAPKKATKTTAKKTAKKAVKKKAAPKKAAPKKATKTAAKKTAKKAVKKKAAPPKAAKKVAKTPTKKNAPKATSDNAGRTKAQARADQIKDSVKKKGASSVIPEIARPTGMYNGIVLVEDVKPFPTRTPYSKKELNTLEEALLVERKRLISELSSLYGVGAEAMDLSRENPGYSVHMAEHATDLQTAEANLGVRSIEEERLEQVEAALERIRNNVNHYGLCLACGAKVGIQRLIARPHAHLCMNCQQTYEQKRRRRG